MAIVLRRRPVLDHADDSGEHSARDTAARSLTDDRADVRRRCRVRQHRNEHSENLATNTAADSPCNGVPECPKIDVLGRAASNVSASTTKLPRHTARSEPMFFRAEPLTVMNWEFLIFTQAVVPTMADSTRPAARNRPASMPNNCGRE